MKPSGLPKQGLYLQRLWQQRGQSKHPFLKCSLVPLTVSQWSKEAWLSSLGLKKCISGPYLPMLLSPGNEKTADKHISNMNKRTNPKP